MRRVEFGPGVDDDIEAATEWYAAERLQLGVAFLDQVDAAMGRIRTLPGQFPFVRKSIQRAMLRRFPYGVFFVEVSDDTIRVIAVLHLHRDPDELAGRE